MSELHTILTDDDMDGIFDDVHVVNSMEDSYPSEPIVVHHRPDNRNVAKSHSKSIFSGKTHFKIGLAIAIALASFSILSLVGIGLIVLIF